MATFPWQAYALPDEDEWLADLIGEQPARIFETFSVPCLHHAHWLALSQYWQGDWTNRTTYGVDRYHALCYILGNVVEQFVPGVTVHRPTDRLGTPFTVQGPGWWVYPWRYGETEDDADEGIRFTDHDAIRSRLASGHPAGQLALDLPGVRQTPDSRFVILAWTGGLQQGLTRAFLGLPYLDNGLLYWQERLELDVDVDSAAFAAPEVSPMGANRHGQLPKPPPFDVEALARGHGLLA